MAFDPKNWTIKTQEAFSAAIDDAKARSNPELTPDHVLSAMMRQDGTIVPAVLAKLGLAPLMVRNQADEAVSRLPSAYGGDEPRMSKELSNKVDNAEAYQKDFKDDYLSVEHLLLAMSDRIAIVRDGQILHISESEKLSEHRLLSIASGAEANNNNQGKITEQIA